MFFSSPTPVPSAVISVAELLRRQHLVEANLLDVQDLAAQRQDRLELAARPCLAEPPADSPSTMNSSHFDGVALLAVGELAGQRG
jgi:hypothetical protein